MLDHIKNILAQDDAVLFIGSGISCWAGLPSWSLVIDELATFVEQRGGNAESILSEARRGDLLQAASYGFHELTKPQIGEFIKKTVRQGKSKPHQIHKKIVELGVRCFLTTNYDGLLEDALRKWRKDWPNRPAITNRHLTETAEIVHARAIDFIFKPHGDANDVESIILTREQYRQLLPGGERHAALDAVKLLLASRPVIYLGFGLRDPDFLYLRDLLSNTYKGGTRDHYAIMADVNSQETEYWRMNYGIHLINYPTTVTADKKKDHGKLLELLDKLSQPIRKVTSMPLEQRVDANTILALARYASRLSSPKKAMVEFPISVTKIDVEKTQQSGIRRKSPQWPVRLFLLDGPPKAILTGLPGAGKTYSISHAAAFLANDLNAKCLEENFSAVDLVIPVLIDLKLYQGNLFDLANRALPEPLSLEFLLKNFKLKFFLDSFNEMPREFWETTAYEVDFSNFIKLIGANSLLIGSRTTDGLRSFEIPLYDLDQIDRRHIESEITSMRLNIGGDFNQEIISLLQKPFYFQLLKSGAISLPKAPKPKDIYQAYFQNLEDSFRERFEVEFSLNEVLLRVAYQAVNRGEEAQLLTFAKAMLTEEIEYHDANLDTMDVLNWLVSKTVLIPYIGSRVAFFHQSATEYLAAKMLARVFANNPNELREKLKLRRWDQALFLTASLLPENLSDKFVAIISDIDIELALNACKYVETGRENLVEQLLNIVLNRVQNGTIEIHDVDWIIEESLPISSSHENILRQLVQSGGSIAGAAVVRLADIKGTKIKEELFSYLRSSPNDFNFLYNGVSRALLPMLNRSDLKKIRSLALEKQSIIENRVEQDDYVGFTSAISTLLGAYDSLEVQKIFLRGKSPKIPGYVAEILCESLWDKGSTEGWQAAATLLLLDINHAATSIYFLSINSRNDKNYSVFDVRHIQKLLSINSNDSEEEWEIYALRAVFEHRDDLKIFAEEAIKSTDDEITIATLRYCMSSEEIAVFDLLEKKLRDGSLKTDFGRLKRLISQSRPNWNGRERLLLELLRQQEVMLAKVLLKESHTFDERIPRNLEIDDVNWWLEWLTTEISTDKIDFRPHWEISEPLANFLAHVLTASAFDELVAKFNSFRCTQREALAKIIGHRLDVSIDQFSEDGINYLLAVLGNYQRDDGSQCRILGNAATENFVLEKLLPLLGDSNSDLNRNLKRNISIAGERHGRRYISV